MPHPDRTRKRHRWSRYARFVPAPAGGLLAFSGLTGAAVSLTPPSPPPDPGAAAEAGGTDSPADRGRAPAAPKARAPAALRARAARRPPRPDRFDAEGLHCLAAAGLLVEAGHDELLDVENRTWADRHLATDLVLNVSPTLACNLRCTYCFQAARGAPLRAAGAGPRATAGNNQAATMSPQVAQQLVAFAAAHLEGCRSLSVAWFGGEPLLALPLIEELGGALGREAARRGADFRADLFTNGTLLTPEAARRLAAAGVQGAVIAVDGPPAVHDSRRATRDGGPTFAATWSHLGPATEHMEIIVQTMVDRANAAHAWDVYEMLAREGLAGKVQFRVARVREGPEPRLELSPRQFGRLQLEGLGRYRGAPGMTVGLPGPRFGCTYRRERAFVVEPSGTLHRCLRTLGRPEWSVGHVATGVTPGAAASTRWLAADPFRLRKCRRCPVLPLCGGGCALELARGRTACFPLRWALDEWLEETARTPAGEAPPPRPAPTGTLADDA